MLMLHLAFPPEETFVLTFCIESSTAQSMVEGQATLDACVAVQGSYDKAWSSLLEANRLQRDTYPYNPQVYHLHLN